jgi:hypothetical protein
MKITLQIFISFLSVVTLAVNAQDPKTNLKHFVFFGGNREGIHDSSFYSHPGITGAQIIYPWKRLEHQKDNYDFSEIVEDLEFLTSKGKKLFVQLQDVTFDSNFVVVPKYLLTDTIYHGGADADYEIVNGKLLKAGWVSRRWDPAVAARWHKLIRTLGKEFDGKIEGINLPESSLTVGEDGKPVPKGFTREIYRDALKTNMKVLRESFTKSTPIQYANFMPGGLYLADLYEYAKEIGLGVGGPDIKVYRPFQMSNSYPLIRNSYGIIPTGVAVQDGNYALINPKTGKQVTVPEILDFAQNYLRLDYVFWCTEEPYYSTQVLPLLRSLR